jgi:catechol 2,3-dioxygenase-like lactoylglutathione lyase family enzyme
MPIQAKYVHTNLIARDWRKLADFYIRILGCVPVPPERDLSGEVMEVGTGVQGAHLTGMHLRLPGWGENGPTLEVFTYNHLADEGEKAVNRSGFGHLAFQVDDVKAARAIILAAGGAVVGEVVTTSITTGARVTWCYVTDPEGNILELQSWDYG